MIGAVAMKYVLGTYFAIWFGYLLLFAALFALSGCAADLLMLFVENPGTAAS